MKRLLGWRFRQTTMVFFACLAFLIGVAVARSGVRISGWWVVVLLLPAAAALRRKSAWTVLLVIVVAVLLGGWRGTQYADNLAQIRAQFESKQTYVVTAADDATYDKYKQLSFDAYNPVVQSTGQQLTGKLSVSGFGESAVFAGDKVAVTGKLYPSRGSYQARLSYAQMHVTKRTTSLIAELRRRFQAGMQTALPEPLASFGMGLLIGQKANLPDSVYDALLMVGLVHIIAVSGYNLTIILRAGSGVFTKYSKRLSLILPLSLIAVFLLFAGASASIVRAAIVSVLSVLAAYYGRSVKPLVLIILAAAITGWMNPYYVWTDVSWYLSFLAFFGVMVVAPLLAQRLPARLQNSLVAMVALESLCAELMTLPYVLYVFGQMSFIGLLANVLVVALVPLAMLLCLVAGLAGMLLPAIAGWVAWPARLLLTYMLDVATALSRIPHIFVQGLSLPLVQLLGLYIIAAAVVYALWNKGRQNGTITDMSSDKNEANN
jgi:competence protein ComEC